MKITRILLTGCMLTAVCMAAPAAAEEPIIYTVKKGDTLWDISRRFIKDPYYWPNLWSHNPTIGNPHLIHPGQKLRIHDGRIELIAVEGKVDEETLAAEPMATAAAAPAAREEVRLVNTFGGARSFIGIGEVATLGTLIDATENRVLLHEGDTGYFEMDDLAAVAAGQRLQLLELGPEIVHPVTKQPIGYQVNHLGFADVTDKTASVAVAVVKDSTREILRGARVRPYQELPPAIPRKPATVNLRGYIVAADEGKIALSQLDVIHVDQGAASGLEVGNELNLFRQRTFTRSARPIKQLEEGNFVELPDVQLGRAIVIDCQEQTAAALIVEVGNLPIYRGDQVATQTP